MTVWIVLYHDYGDHGVAGVFATKALADAYAENERRIQKGKRNRTQYDFVVEETEVVAE